MPESEKHSPDKLHGPCLQIILCLVIFSSALFIYLPRAARTVQESDGGEFAAAAVLNALPHPPGYPLYLTAAKAVVKSDPAQPYYVLSCMSAVMQAIAAAGVFVLVLLINGRVLFSIVTAVAWMIYEPVMRTAVDAEVFALYNLLSLTVITAAVLIYRSGRFSIWRFLVLGLLCGVAGTHHPAVVFWGPLVVAVAYHIGVKENGLRGFSLLLSCITVGAAVGLLPDLLLFTFSTPLVFNPIKTFPELLSHVLRREYGTFSMHASPSPDDKTYVFHYLKITAQNFPAVLAAFPIIGIAVYRKRTPFLAGLFISLLLYIWFLCNLVAPAFEEVYGEFMMRMYSLTAVAGAVAVAAALKFVPKSRMIEILTGLFIVVPGLLHLPASLPGSDNASDITVDLELHEILRELPPKSVFVSSLDRIGMGLMYKQNVFRMRPDVTVIARGRLGSGSYQKILKHNFPLLFSGPETEEISLRTLVDAAQKMGMGVFAYYETDPPRGYRAYPLGAVWQWLPEGRVPAVKDIAENLLAFCAAWPDQLNSINRYRRHSRWVRERIFYMPLLHYKDKMGENWPGIFADIINYARKGDYKNARQLCRLGLKSSGVREHLKPKPYHAQDSG